MKWEQKQAHKEGAEENSPGRESSDEHPKQKTLPKIKSK